VSASRRLEILQAIKTRLEAITIANGYNTNAGQAIYMTDLPVLGPTDPDEALNLTIGDDEVLYQGVNVAAALPIEIQAIARQGQESVVALENILGDIKTAVELEDMTLGGLLVEDPRAIERGQTRVLPRVEGSEYVGVGITYAVTYQESWGAP
jgi:hypothetical protein